MLLCRDGLNRMPIEFTLAKYKLGHLQDSDSPVIGEVSPVVSLNSPSKEGIPVSVSPDRATRHIPYNAKQQGLVIISEFVSSSRVMRGALVVNPWRLQEVSVLIF
jgi:hypothetical protein